MPYTVIFTPEAEEQIAAIYRHVALKASPMVAERYTNAVITYCESMHTFPHRGTRRDDVRPGLRITHYKKRAVIAFSVDDDAIQVSIIGVYYGGQDYEAALQSEEDSLGGN